MKFLIVDDHPDAADTLAAIFQMMGHEAHVARDGETAISMAIQLEPDAVILDIGLPQKDGYEVASQLRQLPAFQDTVIAGCSGYAEESYKQRALKAGCDTYSVKPCDPIGLYESVMVCHVRRRLP